jgi:hypothetical protein
MGAKKWFFAVFSNHTDFTFLPGFMFDCIKLVGFVVNPGDGVFAGDPPFLGQIPDVSDVFV